MSRIERVPISREDGFTLLELQIVLMILGILLLAAAPSYISSRDRAAQNSAMSNVRNAATAAASYAQDNNGFLGMTYTALKGYNGNLPTINVIGTPTKTSFCIANQVADWIAYKRGPSGAITLTACSGP